MASAFAAGMLGAGFAPGLPGSLRLIAMLLETAHVAAWSWVWLRQQRQCHRAALEYLIAMPTARTVVVWADGSIEVRSS